MGLFSSDWIAGCNPERHGWRGWSGKISPFTRSPRIAAWVYEQWN